ncbi:MAG: HEAT repeat domain-containing protein [Gemmataceae bacterium]|nr:HEAT repeat domain-containing protein [Gemmataceae bacterium]MDW8243001.1 HEAT repeat domain-containing protein [Thermogemmata sp.]
MSEQFSATVPRVAVLASAIVLAIGYGCQRNDKPMVEEAAGDKTGGSAGPVVPEAALIIDRHCKALASSSEQGRREAIAYFAQHGADTAVIDRLVSLLSDPGTAGLGKTHPGRISSTREAAARALLAVGEVGETALREHGIAALRAGLRDRQAAVREHSAYTLGLLGPLAQPAADDLLEAAQDTEAAVRHAALDAVRQVGIGQPRKYVRLLNHPDAETARLAAELAPLITSVPVEEVSTLIQALQSSEPTVRIAAAQLLARLGPAAAPAVPALIGAIRQTYPSMVDADQPVLGNLGTELAYWQALSAIGVQAAAAAVELLQHGHPLVRLLAAYTLGEMGPAVARTAGDALKKLLQDQYSDVAIEAACALLRLDIATDEARALLRAAMDAPNAVALSAISVLPRLGDQARPLLPAALAKLTSDNPYARYAAVALVAQLPPEQGRPYVAQLAPLTSDSEPLIRAQLARTLQQLGPIAGELAQAVARAWQQEKDEALRDAWIDALLAMGAAAKPVVESLCQAAADQHLPAARRLRLIAALPQADASHPSVVKTLLQLTQEKDADVRAAAARALGQMTTLPVEAFQRLASMAQQDNRLPPRRAALLALLSLGPAAATVRTDLQNVANRTPPDSLSLLAQAGLALMDRQPDRARRLLATGLSSPKPDVRQAAVEALQVVPPTSAELPALQRLLRDPAAETRAAAAVVIGRLGSLAQAAVPHLLLLLNDPDPAVRLAAIETLARIGPAAKPAADKLRQLTGDPVLGPTARQALEKLGLPLPPAPGLPQGR